MARKPRDTDDPVALSPSWLRQRWRKLGVLGVTCVVLATVVIAAGKGVLGVVEDKARNWTASVFDGEQAATASGPLVTVIDLGQTPAGGGWIVPGKTFVQLGSMTGLDPDNPAVWKDWEARNGAVRAKYLALQIAVQGNSAKAILLTGLDINVLNRRPPLSGLLLASPGSGGPLDTRRFEVDLDAPNPTVTPFEEHFEPDANGLWTRPANFPFKVSESDPEYFVIIFATDTCDCDVTGTLRWIADGQQGTTAIARNGRPFRITANTAQTAWYTTSGCRNDKEACQ